MYNVLRHRFPVKYSSFYSIKGRSLARRQDCSGQVISALTFQTTIIHRCTIINSQLSTGKGRPSAALTTSVFNETRREFSYVYTHTVRSGPFIQL